MRTLRKLIDIALSREDLPGVALGCLVIVICMLTVLAGVTH